MGRQQKRWSAARLMPLIQFGEANIAQTFSKSLLIVLLNVQCCYMLLMLFKERQLYYGYVRGTLRFFIKKLVQIAKKLVQFSCNLKH